jgi:hypothetical protein
MAIIEFEAISADLSVSVGEFEKKHPILSFRVQLIQGESMKLSSDEKFEDLDGRVTVFPDIGELQENQNAFGTLHYFAAHDDDFHPFPPSFIIQATIPASQFDELLSAAKLGRIPSEISVDIEGMEHDWQPDGSGKKWDNKASPRLPVNSVRFSVPLTPYAEEDGSERRPSENSMPAIRLQADQLMQRLDSHSSEISKTLKHVFWAVVILGGLLVFSRW